MRLIEKTESGDMVWERYLNMDDSYITTINDDKYVWFRVKVAYNEIPISKDVTMLRAAIEKQAKYNHLDAMSQIYNKILTE